MAVVFISPKKRQRMFFMILGVSVILFWVIIFFWVLLFSGPSETEVTVEFKKPKININLGIFDSKQFKDLELFEKLPLQFSYTAVNAQGQSVEGVISAFSEDEARKQLKQQGLDAGLIELLNPGRENPFIPY